MAGSTEHPPARPPRSEVDLEGIPAELTRLRQWVCWVHLLRDGKWTKMPVQTDGTPADSTDSETWTDFDSVCAAYEAGKHDGIGFVLTADDPYVCNDLDKCVQRDGSIHPKVRAYIDQFDSFTEWSQSNKGVHVWMKGHGHPKRSRKGAFELYENIRFIAMTGRSVPGTRSTIEERQEALDTIVADVFGEPEAVKEHLPEHPNPQEDAEIIKRAESGAGGRVFKALMAGKFEGLYDSQSEADSALAFHLAAVTSDPNAIERIMRTSPLEREKWDARRGSTTWLREQIDRATTERRPASRHTAPRVRDSGDWPPPGSDPEQPEKGYEFRSYTAREFAESEPEEVSWIIEGYAARGTMTELDGAVKGGKTTLTLQAVRAITSGRPFLGKPAAKGRVVIVTEEPKAAFRQALHRAHLDGCDDLIVIFKADHPGIPWKALADYAVQLAVEQSSALLICDTISGLAEFRDDDENSTGPAMQALEPLQAATAADIGVWLNRHDRKSGGGLGSSGRGASAMSGMVDTILHLTDASSPSHENRRKIEGVSRFDGAPTGELIEFADGEMRAIGDIGQVERAECTDAILEVVTMTERESGMQRKAIEEAIARITGKTFANTTITRSLNYLHEDSGLLDRDKDPDNKRAFVYWRTDKSIDDSTKGLTRGILIDPPVLQNSTALINDSTPRTRGKKEDSTPQALDGINDQKAVRGESTNGHIHEEDPAVLAVLEELQAAARAPREGSQ